MVTLALRCLFVIGLGAVVATDWAKVIAVLPSFYDCSVMVVWNFWDCSARCCGCVGVVWDLCRCVLVVFSGVGITWSLWNLCGCVAILLCVDRCENPFDIVECNAVTITNIL